MQQGARLKALLREMPSISRVLQLYLLSVLSVNAEAIERYCKLGHREFNSPLGIAQLQAGAQSLKREFAHSGWYCHSSADIVSPFLQGVEVAYDAKSIPANRTPVAHTLLVIALVLTTSLYL